MAFSYKDYEESEAVKRAREQQQKSSTYSESKSVTEARNKMNEHEQKKVGDWTGGTYADALQQAMDRINNREAFTYDLNGDALYQQYKDQYMSLGKLAMNDTIGQASAMTGGYGNSYAATAGNQAYQGYLSQLNDVIPELYSLALNKYNMEGDDLYNQYNMYADRYNTEYGEYRDRVADWNTEADRLYNQYYNESNLDYSRFSSDRDYYANQYNTERQYDYNQYSDEYNRAFTQYQQGVAEQQWQSEFDESQRQYNQNFAEQQRQYDQDFAEQQRQYNESLAEQQRQYDQSFAEDQRQYNESLAESQRQYNTSLAEDQRQYNASYSQNQAAIDAQKEANAIAQSNVDQAAFDMANQIAQARSSAQYYKYSPNNPSNAFISRSAFANYNDGKTIKIDGEFRRFDSYEQYVDAVLKSKYDSGQLTEWEVAALKADWGIS